MKRGGLEARAGTQRETHRLIWPESLFVCLPGCRLFPGGAVPTPRKKSRGCTAPPRMFDQHARYGGERAFCMSLFFFACQPSSSGLSSFFFLLVSPAHQDLFFPLFFFCLLAPCTLRSHRPGTGMRSGISVVLPVYVQDPFFLHLC